MKRKTFNKLKIILGLGILSVVILVALSSSFQHEAPENTIRILVDRPMTEKHIRVAPLIEELHYSYVKNGDDFDLLPADSSRPVLHFQLVRDENTRALLFLKGDADVIYDGLSFAKTEWVKSKRVPRFARMFVNGGDNISNLALNRESEVLKIPEVNSAIRHGLPVKHWSETVFFHWVEPLLVEDSDQRESILSKLKIPPGTTLRYLTTSSREGQQLAYLTREALGKLGIKVNIQILEPALFYAKIRKREFDLFASNSAQGGTKNILDLPNTETIPLFRWKHALIVNSRVKVPETITTELDFSFRFLAGLQLH